MNRTRKLLAIGATVVGFGGAGIIAAAAQSSTTTKPAVVTPAPAKDGDTVQQGDQTTPDVPGASETPEPAVKSATAKATAAETPGTETETANDGPGGHADAPGAVDHQFDGQE
ncbi:MAG TPA: hypothetical protein VGP92_03450 [Acidimicrobiia bacterium]|jgi:hypothetical protein|nr:hypothetical protein [Acidimicrobiia bacterium]